MKSKARGQTLSFASFNLYDWAGKSKYCPPLVGSKGSFGESMELVIALED